MNFQLSSESYRIQARFIPAPGDPLPSTLELSDVCEDCDYVLKQLRARSRGKSADSGIYSWEGAAYKPNVGALKASADGGCALCRLIVVYDEHESEVPESFDGPALRIRCWPPHGVAPTDSVLSKLTHLIVTNPGNETEWSKGYHLRVCFESDNECMPSWNLDVPPEAPLTLARSWIQECCQDHQDCLPAGEMDPPTRLIEVEANINGNTRLLIPSKAQTWKYVALSYCWGNGLPRSRLTLANYENYLEEIPLDDSERTLSDALKVTRLLGYRYLWIDSLCIVQDDELDWQRECSRMDDVYANADLVLAAVACPDAATQFLYREPLGRMTCEVPIICDNKTHLGSLSIRPPPSRRREANQVPLFNRGWALQERLFARRYLSFGSFQMTYQCHTGHRTEVGHAPYEVSHMSGFSLHSRTLLSFSNSPGNSEGNISARSFYSIVSTYSYALLSYEDDRLPALSAIARRYHVHTGDRYFAGLWEKDFVLGLAWRRISSKRHRSDNVSPTKFPPSWSWAMTKNSVTWPGDPENDTYEMIPWVRIVDVQVNLVGVDPFGQVDGGYVVVQGHLHRFQCDNFEILDTSNLSFQPDDPARYPHSGGKYELLGLILGILRGGFIDMDDIFLISILVIEAANRKDEKEPAYKRVGMIHGVFYEHEFKLAKSGEKTTIRII